MTANTRPRALAVLTAFVGLLGVVAISIPTSGAVEPSAVRLNVGTDGRYFEYGTTRQTLTTPQNGCQITSPENLIDLSSTPVVAPASKSSSPGLGADGIGVKLSPSSGNGTPCSQVESLESLILAPSTLTNGPLFGRQFTGVRLDTEMTGNAVVRLTFSGGATQPPVTYTLQTGTAITPEEFAEADTTAPYVVSSSDTDRIDACAAPNSSGPNSGSNDNCQWGVTPRDAFTTITLTTTQGTVALEGGGDFALGSDTDTLLYLANGTPTAVNDAYETDEDTTLTGDVTDNDTDPDSESLTGATVTSAPSHGDVNLSTNGTFSYVPDLNFNGADSFTYTVTDGSGAVSNPATVGITVDAVNDAPEATGNGLTIEEGSNGTVDVADDVDADAVLTVVCTVPAGWDIDDLGGGEVRITPPAAFVGEITISCTVTDEDGATTESPVTIAVGVTNVNDAPEAVDDEADFDAENGASVEIDVLANDTDADTGDALSVEDLTLVDGGSASVEGGIVTYSPPVGTTAPVTFTYRAYDGEAYSNVATVTVYPRICSDETVSASDEGVSGSFTRLSDPEECKRYTLLVDLTERDSILFQPSGEAQDIAYRGVVSFGVDTAPLPGESPLRLSYDPLGGFDFQPMLWCHSPQFDTTNILETDEGFPLFAAVTSATLPNAAETWCIASAYTQGDEDGNLIAYFQVYGLDDPRMTR
jgi:hypothetical protein